MYNSSHQIIFLFLTKYLIYQIFIDKIIEITILVGFGDIGVEGSEVDGGVELKRM
jgi:hypothetical protein